MTRDEILQAFDDINFVYNDCTKYDTLKRMLEELTERKHGEWLLMESIYDDCTWICSVCGEPFILIAGEPDQNNYNFCPNCGADMRERREGDKG